MCETPSATPGEGLTDLRPDVVEAGDRRLEVTGLGAFLEVARRVAAEPEVRRTAAGFIGYGATREGDRVLIAVDTEHHPLIVEAVARALREKGARVDVITVDAGPDREFDELDEVRVIMRREPWARNPRRWEGIPWVEELALKNGYDLLVHGKGGGIPDVPHRYEAIPWLQPEQFLSPATTFPRDLHSLINRKVWAAFRELGRGGRVHLTDPEGTELTYTLWPEYFDGTRRGYGELPWWGHVMGHAPTPILPQEDATGVVAGTTNHFSRPFPPVRVTLQAGRVESVTGGGAYGAAWRELLEESRDTRYPCFPRPGLFWLWEVAIGTNPKISRPRRIDRLSSGGMEWERRRSGVIHVGMGTRWRGPEEVWAGERGLLYGHLHVHLLAPTLVVTTPRGEEIRVIEAGHLTALDDPEVRQLAAAHGDPDRLLSEDWVPEVPGVTAEGSYEEYARDPAAFIYRAVQAATGG
jgi:hypothetical protein